MQSHFKKILYLSMFFMLSNIYANVNININIKKPLPPYLNDWKYDQSIIQLILTSTSIYTNVRVSFTIEDIDKGKIVAKTKDNSSYMPKYDLFTGIPLVLKGNQIVNEQALDIDASIKGTTLSTQMLPEGNYEFCIKLLDQNGIEITSNGKTCDQSFVTIPDPPMLIKPIEGEEISKTPLPLPNFIWSPVANPPLGMIISYQLKLSPKFKGQEDRFALDNNTPLFNKLLQPGRTSYQYLPSDIPFSKYPDAIGFVWQIQAFDQNGKIATRNEGKSEIGYFILKVTDSVDTGSSSDTSLGDSTKSTKDDSSSAIKSEDDKAYSPLEINCGILPPSNKSISTKIYGKGDKVKIGEFELTFTSIPTVSDSLIKGQGYIEIPFLKNIRLSVEFLDGIKVNNNNEVIFGIVNSKISSGLPLVGELGLNKTQIANFLDKASQSSQLLNKIADFSEINLPIGISNFIKGSPFLLGITSAKFTPEGAVTTAAFKYSIPGLGLNAELFFDGKVCINSSGFADNKELYLVEDLSYPNSDDGWKFNFKKKSGINKNTYITFDKSGFKEVFISAEINFPRTWIKPYPDDKISKVSLNVQTNFSETKDLVATCLLPDFTPSGLEDFVIQVNEMYYDFSTKSNPSSIIFPSEFIGDKSTNWNGFYIPKAKLKLPTQFKLGTGNPIQGNINNLILDKTGFTASAIISNIADFKLSSFSAKLDTFAIKFVQSSFKEGKIIGKLRLPISSDELKYSGILTIDEFGEQNYNFLVNTDLPSGLNVPMWKAKFQLENTSFVKISKTSTGFKDTILINANVSIDDKIGNLPLKFELMRVENFLITENSIKGGTFKLGSPQKKFNGFDVSASNIQLVSKGLDKFGLKFDLNASLYDGVFAGTTGFTIWSKFESSTFNYESIELNTIKVKGEIIPGLVNLDGELNIFNEDVIFGDGFRGNIKTIIMEKITGDITVQFGSKKKTNPSERFNYWFVDASLVLSTGFPVMTGVGIYGFGGGASYHMKLEKPVPNPPATNIVAEVNKIGTTASGVKYTPDEGSGLSFKAKVFFGTHPEPTPLNGSMEFTVAFNSSGGLSFIQFYGEGYLVSKILDHSNYLGKGTADMSYNFGTQCFQGHFQIVMDVAGVLSETAYLDILADKKNSKWHFYLGTWENPCSMSIAGLTTISNYFMVGNDLQGGLPPFPPDVVNIFKTVGKPLPSVNPTDRSKQSLGKGISFGGSTNFGGDYKFLIFYAKLAAGFGFDLNLQNYPGVSCKGAGNIGIDGWYAMGQMYAYVAASIGLHVDLWFVEGNFEILSGGFAAILQGGIPNPTWAKGSIAGYYRILKGLVKGHCSFEFNYGTPCEMVSDNPLAIGLISDIQPTGNDVSVFTSPVATFNFPIPDGSNENIFEIQTIGSNGLPGPIRTFKLILDNKELYQTSGKKAEGFKESVADEGTTLVLTPTNMLKETTNYTFRIKAHGEEFKLGGWQITKYEKDGDPRKGQAIIKDTSVSFTTGKSPNFVVNSNVIYGFPAKGQRSFIADKSLNRGYIAMRQAQEDIFNPELLLEKYPEYKNQKDKLDVEYLAVFKYDGTKSKEVPLTFVKQYNKDPRVEFDISHLEKSKIYNLQLIARIKPKLDNLQLYSGLTKLSQIISDRKKKTVKAELVKKDFKADKDLNDLVNKTKDKDIKVNENLKKDNKASKEIYGDVDVNLQKNGKKDIDYKDIEKKDYDIKGTGQKKSKKTDISISNLDKKDYSYDDVDTKNYSKSFYKSEDDKSRKKSSKGSDDDKYSFSKDFSPIDKGLGKIGIKNYAFDNSSEVIDTVSTKKIDVNTMKLLRTNDKRIFESDFYFKTSKFSTITEKINHFSMDKIIYMDYASILTIRLKCTEPFDEIDLLGQPYSKSNYGSAYDAKFGPFVKLSDDETTEWFNAMNENIYKIYEGNTGLSFTDGSAATNPLTYWLNETEAGYSGCKEGTFKWEKITPTISDFPEKTYRKQYKKDNYLVKGNGPNRFYSLENAIASTSNWDGQAFDFNAFYAATLDNIYLHGIILKKFLHLWMISAWGAGADPGYSCLYVNCIASNFGNYSKALQIYYATLGVEPYELDRSYKCTEWLWKNLDGTSNATKPFGEMAYFISGYYPPAPELYSPDISWNWNFKHKRRIPFYAY